MNRIVLGAVTAVLGGQILLAQVAPPQAAPEGFMVAGIVANSITGTGIAGVTVTLTSPLNRYDATTIATGEFQFAAVKAGTYYASFQKTGFFPADPRFSNGVPAIRVGPGLDAEHVQIQLAPAATLRGRVFDPDGKPASNVQVEATPGAGKVALTGDDGSFELTNFAPGSYILQAVPGENKPVEQADGTRTKIVAAYYPSGSDPTQAAKVNLRAGDDLSGYEFHLQRTTVYRLRGVALDENGNPAGQMRVSLVRNGAAESNIGPQVFWGPGSGFHVDSPRLNQVEAAVGTDDAGKFEFPAVTSGEWTLIAESGSTPGHPIAYGLNKTIVGTHDVEGLKVQIASSFTWTGTFDWGETAGPKQNRRGFVIVFGSDGVPQVHSGRLQPDGSIRFEQLPAGRYYIAAAPAESGYYASAVLLGTTDVTGQVVELSATSPPLRIAFKPGAGTVRGTVEQANGATVALIPQTFASGTADMVRLATCARDGTFDIGSVPPGSYYALALESTGSLPSRDTLRTLLPRATSVRVEESSTASLNLQIQR